MIEIIDLHKGFGNNKVLRGVDLKILKGETITILGGSGSGKSVLLKHIAGLLKPDKGSIKVNGKDIVGMDEEQIADVQNKIGMLFQGAALFDSLTVGENVAFGLRRLTDLKEMEIKETVSEKLHMVGLKNIEHLKPAELSGGMKKRVGLARAIAINPEYIMYDEPTTGLDPIMADIINEMILHLQEELKITSIVVTHDMVSAYKISNRLAMLYEGKIIETDSVEMIKNSKNPVVKQFISGSSEGPIKMKIRE